MPRSERTTALDFATLYNELKQLRAYGLRQAISKGKVSVLVELAVEHHPSAIGQIQSGTADQRHHFIAGQVKSILEPAIEQLDGGRNQAIVELFALALPTPTPNLDERRSAAAAKVGCAASTFGRYRERPLLESLAKLILYQCGQAKEIDPPLTPGPPNSDNQTSDLLSIPTDGDGEYKQDRRRLREWASGILLWGVPLAAAIGIGTYGLTRFIGSRLSSDNAPVEYPELDTLTLIRVAKRHPYTLDAEASPGDRLFVRILYENGSSASSEQTAIDVQLTIRLNEAGVATHHVMGIDIGAINAPTVKKPSYIETTSPARVVFLPGTATWEHNIGSVDHPHRIVTKLPYFSPNSMIPRNIIDPYEYPSKGFWGIIEFQLAVVSASKKS